MRPMLRCSAFLALAVVAHVLSAAERVPLRINSRGRGAGPSIPVSGGIPFPRGAVQSPGQVRLVRDGSEIPCQVEPTAVWSDGSVKWALVSAVLPPDEGASMSIEFGKDVTPRRVSGPLVVLEEEKGVVVSGGDFRAVIRRDGQGGIDALSWSGATVIDPATPAGLVVETLRVSVDDTGNVLPAHEFVCRDPGATLQTGRPRIDRIEVEANGPVVARICIRGSILLPRFGETLPDEVKRREPAGEMPFSMRLTFFRDCPIVIGQHQVVFSGEPDHDFITHWGVRLPGMGSDNSCLVLEPGVAVRRAGGDVAELDEGGRLCHAPLRRGLAVIRHGWENRPCAISCENRTAWIDFWPRAAGVWDLRRYAREWACGEAGDTRNPQSIKRFAEFAARGMAKSHDFAVWFGHTAGFAESADALARALSAPALLVAPPAWYASTGVLGSFAPEQRDGPFARLDAATRRELDYHLYCQDLFRWHGKLDYGNWQTRFGQVHRHDRWERDYGRWGWALNDGAGRIGHVLMQQFLRTLDRRYLDAGEAFCRANYDTSMVHTLLRLENTRTWWTARGCTHRHNVQPFGCPYIGMRGSSPGGQRILYHLTGDGVIRDGLELVADACFQYASGDRSRMCNSGGSDGLGTASNALLWKYETTGDPKYLEACRGVLDRSNLIPPESNAKLGYASDFGLFQAAVEYAELTGDRDFRNRVAQLARFGLQQKDARPFTVAMAAAARLSDDPVLRTKLGDVLASAATSFDDSLAALPVHRWPGHGGWRTPRFDPNLLRDVPCAMSALNKSAPVLDWPVPVPSLKPVPAALPAGWYRPGGLQSKDDAIATGSELMGLPFRDEGRTGVPVHGLGSVLAYIDLAEPVSDGAVAATRVARHTVAPPEGHAFFNGDGRSAVRGRAGPVGVVMRLRPAEGGVPGSLRLDVACFVPPDTGRVASWGLLVPLSFGRNRHAITVTAPGAFRLERIRPDQNDERIPNWLTSEYQHGEGAPLWPVWRRCGISVGPGPFYRIWKANRADTSPLFCDQGRGGAAWLDVTDRGGRNHWGVSVRLLRPAPLVKATDRQAVRLDFENGMLQIQFHDAAAPPLRQGALTMELTGAAELVFHDGWRPPFSRSELTREQYERFIDDLNYGENYGLNALRFRLSTTHKVRGRQWMERVRDLGIEPREILYGMQWRDGLARHCERLGVRWDADDLEGSVERVVEHYRR